IFAALVFYATLNVQHQDYNEDLGIDNFVDEPNIAIVKTLLLQYQPKYLDILPLYVVLLGIFPLVLLLLRRHLALPVMVSAVTYLLTLHFGWQPLRLSVRQAQLPDGVSELHALPAGFILSAKGVSPLSS